MAIYKTLVKKISVHSTGKIKKKDYKEKGLLAVIDQGQQLIGGYTDNIEKKVNCELPVLIFGDHTRIVKYIDFPFGSGADGTKILQAKDVVLPKYLYYGTQYLTLIMSDRGYARHYQYIEKMDLPVPTHDEQKRIVCHIEELFSKLDAGKEILKKTKQQLAVYRQAVLKKAFENVEKKQTIRELSQVVTSGSRGWAKYYSNKGARFIRITDLTRDRIVLKDDNIQLVKVPEKAEGRRSQLKEGDVLVSITADLGSIALIPEDMGEAYINQHIAMIRFNNIVQSEFMAWYLKSDYGQKDLLKNKRGAGKLGLGLEDIRNILVPVVNDEFAEKTVRIINSRLSVCDNIEKTIDAVMQQAEVMRQSILKSAFEGRLSS